MDAFAQPPGHTGTTRRSCTEGGKVDLCSSGIERKHLMTSRATFFWLRLWQQQTLDEAKWRNPAEGCRADGAAACVSQEQQREFVVRTSFLNGVLFRTRGGLFAFVEQPSLVCAHTRKDKNWYSNQAVVRFLVRTAALRSCTLSKFKDA